VHSACVTGHVLTLENLAKILDDFILRPREKLDLCLKVSDLQAHRERPEKRIEKWSDLLLLAQAELALRDAILVPARRLSAASIVSTLTMVTAPTPKWHALRVLLAAGLRRRRVLAVAVDRVLLGISSTTNGACTGRTRTSCDGLRLGLPLVPGMGSDVSVLSKPWLVDHRKSAALFA
jgi:hypothetical protein